MILRILFILSVQAYNWAAFNEPLRTKNGAVATDHPQASVIGVEILKNGGNAFDAAIATALAIGVANPHSSGIGGGDFIMHYSVDDDAVGVIDCRESAPKDISRSHYLVDGKYETRLSQRGGLAVAIPGELRGLELLHKKYGSLPWRELVEPAQKLARNGVEVSHYFHRILKKYAQKFKKDELLKKVFYPNGKVPDVGSKIKRLGLAESLDSIANNGANAFYEGPIAEAIISTIQAAGGVMTLADLKSYKAREIEALKGKYEGVEVYTMPSPSSGGLILLQMLDVLSHFPLQQWGHNSSKTIHHIVETMKHAYAFRAEYMGDDRYIDIPYEQLRSKETIEKIVNAIQNSKVTRPTNFYGKSFLKDDHGTTHFSVIDRNGNAVAFTATINTFFGAKLGVPDYGIILNNEMDDFSLNPGIPNAYGLIGSLANAIAPGKKPLSSMSPTMVIREGKVDMILGGSGGPRIITGVLQVLLNSLTYTMDAQAAVNSPRVHHQWMPENLYLETEIPSDVWSNLILKGHIVKPLRMRNVIQLIQIRKGWIESASDPRKGGQPAGY